MIIILNILFFLLAYAFGAITMAIFTISSRESAMEEALRMTEAMREYEEKTIDVSELVKDDKQK